MTDETGKQWGTSELFELQQASLNKQAKPAPMIIADGLRTPENLGAVIRLADAMGSRRILLVNNEPHETMTRKISRISRGTDRHIEINQVSKSEFLNNCASFQPMIALELTTKAQNLLNTLLPEQCSLVIGSERHGISEEVLEKCQQAVYIPMFGINGSMNVTHALAIMLFEWRRQHRD